MNYKYLTPKNGILFFFMLNSIISFAQSKKEQLISLKLSFDSLNNVLISERNISKQNSINFNSKISLLEDQITILNKSLDEKVKEGKLLKESFSEKDREIQRKNDEIIELRQKIKDVRDSINSISQIIDTIVWEIPDSLFWGAAEFNLNLLLPIYKFNSPKGNSLVSRDNKILISYDYNYTHWSDEYEGKPLFYKIKDAINYYARDLNDIQIIENEGFTIKGKNSSNQLIVIKGIYDELVSMQGRDEGEPSWLSSNTLIIKITANQVDVEEFNYISDLIINNFSSKSIVYKY